MQSGSVGEVSVGQRIEADIKCYYYCNLIHISLRQTF